MHGVGVHFHNKETTEFVLITLVVCCRRETASAQQATLNLLHHMHSFHSRQSAEARQERVSRIRRAKSMPKMEDEEVSTVAI